MGLDIVPRPLRQRRLSTFQIPTQASRKLDSARSTDSKRSDSRWGVSSVRYRNSLDLGISPRLPRSTTDLRLHALQQHGWSWPTPDPSRVLTSWEGRKLGTRRDDPSVPAYLARNVNVKTAKAIQDDVALSARSLPPISSDGVSMLRRPTRRKTDPVPEEGHMFQMIIKGRELKPYSFQGNDAKADEFYTNNFPLLCHKVKDKSAPSSAITKQVVEENLRMPSGRRRARDINERMWRAEESLAWMEQESAGEGEAMVTELRDLIFDPTAWPWNKQRYIFPKEYCEVK